MWSTVLDLCSQVLEAYPTTAKEDSAMLSKSLPPLKRLAVRTRRQEKRLVRHIQALAEGQLERNPPLPSHGSSQAQLEPARV